MSRIIEQIVKSSEPNDKCLIQLINLHWVIGLQKQPINKYII